VPITRRFPRDNPRKVFPLHNEHDMMQIAVVLHDCTQAEWHFARGVDPLAWFANATAEDLAYVQSLAFPVGLFGEYFAPDSTFECGAECEACDTLVFARFRWTNPIIIGPGGRRFGGRPVDMPDPLFDPEIQDLFNEDKARYLLAQQEARRQVKP